MKIKLTSVYVDDQNKALRFYTEVLGLVKKADFSQGLFRWLTVASPEDPDGTELQLARNDDDAAKAYQQAMFERGQPGAMFFTDDVKGDYERIKARGAEFTMPPTNVTGSTIAMLNDTCGNLIQLTQLARHSLSGEEGTDREKQIPKAISTERWVATIHVRRSRATSKTMGQSLLLASHLKNLCRR
ncbi:MAG TPA: VOC family protein [Terriglobales bacterium]|nr:VOC family protein [Terriglobales bacterium]